MKIIKELEKYPPFMTSEHLVELGLFSSTDAVYSARLRGTSPDYIKLKRKVLYAKESVIEFLERGFQKSSDTEYFEE